MPSHDSNPADPAWASAVVLHPHPSYGGDRFNHVVSALYHALPGAGVTAARFDFSSDDVAAAAAETVDVIAALEPRPSFAVGYSFGGGVAATVTDERLAGWVLIAPALPLVETSIGLDARPKLVLAAAHDQFFPPAAVAEVIAEWRTTEHAVIGGADHMLMGRTDAVVAAVLPWIEALRPAGR